MLDAARPFGSVSTAEDPVDRVVWPHSDLNIESPELMLLPRVRTDAITAWWDAETEFPALRKASLSLRTSNGNSFLTPSQSLSLFEPIAVDPMAGSYVRTLIVEPLTDPVPSPATR